MKKHSKILIAVSLCCGIIYLSCSKSNNLADAYGNFEAREVTISSQLQGELVFLDIEEGQYYEKGKLAGIIDTVSFYLTREKLLAQKSVIRARSNNILSQIKVLEEEKKNLITEKRRLENLVKDNAATQKQLDDINGKLNVLELNIESVKQQNKIILAEMEVLKSELGQIDNQISKCKIINPVNGTVIERFIEQNEIVTPAHPVYKITNLKELDLKVYIDGSQLAEIKIGDTVTVAIDSGKKTMRNFKGVISWISSEVEFTPKTIQTREERVNMVYAVKIMVVNDGSIKIGMPGEVYF
ncbi:MAG: HlyD family efflux transporter periplasmic adaptor subunit [Bacteroidales bacterium]|nr:MAG: HlyD family efflux transporter periplasmic adaptor subunit [Bacteroidales bacterium]